MSNIGIVKEFIFLSYNNKKVFNYLQLSFIKALILQHFDLKSHIQIKTNILGYTIGRVLNQLNLDLDAQLCYDSSAIALTGL